MLDVSLTWVGAQAYKALGLSSFQLGKRPRKFGDELGGTFCAKSYELKLR